MSEGPVTGRGAGGQFRKGKAVKGDAVTQWFIREILPLEPSLMHYLQHNWRNASDIVDLRQEVYVRVLQAAREQIPDNAHRFLLTCARNLLINLVRRSQVVPIEAVADLEALGVAIDSPEPDRSVIAREELRLLQAALEQLPPRAREAAKLAYLENLSGSEIAARMGVTKSAASKHLSKAILILTNALYGASDDNGKKP